MMSLAALKTREYRLDEYQQDAIRTAGDRKDDIACHALGVAGEAGEVADLIKKHLFHGHQLDTEKAAQELGDVLWYVAVLAHRMGISLSRVAAMNVDKLHSRYPDGFDTERSKNRGESDQDNPGEEASATRRAIASVVVATGVSPSEITLCERPIECEEMA